MSVILATSEVEIGRSKFEARTGKKLFRPYFKKQVIVHAFNPHNSVV
jgi:hypothetical protein